MINNLAFYNSGIQLFAIFMYQYFLTLWPLYIVIGMLSLLIFLQTIAAAWTFSGYRIEKKNTTDEKREPGITFLVSALYLVSCFNIHLAGYPIFAIVAATHAAIMMLSSFFIWVKS